MLNCSQYRSACRNRGRNSFVGKYAATVEVCSRFLFFLQALSCSCSMWVNALMGRVESGKIQIHRTG
jgi:hypothetical protein